jgi:hypothetical protein
VAEVAIISSQTSPLTADALALGVGTRQEPLTHAVPAFAERVARSFVWPGDETVEGLGHVENGRRHGVSFHNKWLSFAGYFFFGRQILGGGAKCFFTLLLNLLVGNVDDTS